MKEFKGIWDITEMENCDEAELNVLGIPHFNINNKGSGRFQFSNFSGIFDARMKKSKSGLKTLTFKWGGNDGDYEETGTGWIQLSTTNTIKGLLTFEYLDDRTFTGMLRE